MARRIDFNPQPTVNPMQNLNQGLSMGLGLAGGIQNIQQGQQQMQMQQEQMQMQKRQQEFAELNDMYKLRQNLPKRLRFDLDKSIISKASKMFPDQGLDPEGLTPEDSADADDYVHLLGRRMTGELDDKGFEQAVGMIMQRANAKEARIIGDLQRTFQTGSGGEMNTLTPDQIQAISMGDVDAQRRLFPQGIPANLSPQAIISGRRDRFGDSQTQALWSGDRQAFFEAFPNPTKEQLDMFQKMRKTKVQEDNARLIEMRSAFNVVQDAGRALDLIQRNPRATGAMGYIAKINPLSDASKLDGILLQSIRDNIGIDSLLNIKRMGAGLGHVPQTQLITLQSLLGRLDIRFPDELEENLKRIYNIYADAIFGEGGGPPVDGGGLRYQLGFDFETGRKLDNPQPWLGVMKYGETFPAPLDIGRRALGPATEASPESQSVAPEAWDDARERRYQELLRKRGGR